jgi:transposase
MKFVGVDLHKQSITVCVMAKVDGRRKVLARQRFACCTPQHIRNFFEQLGRFQVTVEATSNYEWFLLLVEDLADRCVLSHPRKLRVIAESKNKSDKLDAKVLAEFLLLDMLPEAWRPTPRVRQHRVLVRHRRWLDGRITSVKCKLRNKLAHYNADIASLFTERGEQHLAQVAMCAADRFEVQQLQVELQLFMTQMEQTNQQLREFARSGPLAEQEARAVLATIPQVGTVTIDAVLSELGDWRRFRNMKRVVAYAGLDPGHRESDRKVKRLSISKEGSRVLRWALIQAAWRLVNNSPRWKTVFETLKGNTGSKKKAIVGVARRLLCVMFAMLRDGKRYEILAA